MSNVTNEEIINGLVKENTLLKKFINRKNLAAKFEEYKKEIGRNG